jgi:hypothetical protein
LLLKEIEELTQHVVQRAFAPAGTAEPILDTLVDFVAGHTMKETVEGQAVAALRIPKRMHVFGTCLRSKFQGMQRTRIPGGRKVALASQLVTKRDSAVLTGIFKEIEGNARSACSRLHPKLLRHPAVLHRSMLESCSASWRWQPQSSCK